MQVITKNIADLIPADYNPRKKLQPGDKEYEKLKKSIQEFGYVDPVIWNERTGHVVGGHQRLEVMQEMGVTEVMVSVVDLPEDKEKALNVALNKISGEWDQDKLVDLLHELGDMVELTGFDAEEIDKLFEKKGKVQEDDFDADAAMAEITEPITKRGDIWQLGRHRLMCGDSTSIDVVEKLMDGVKANLVVTDPPYNVDYIGKTKDALKIQNDKMSDNSFYQFLFDAFSNGFVVSESGAPIYIFHADSEGLNFRKAMIDAGYKLAQCCIWVKQSMVMGRQDYQWQHEPILYGWKEGAAHKWHSDRKQTTIWNFNRPSRSSDHPTMKPLELMAYPIKNSSVANCIVLDLFGGSGSTLIACEQLNRICYMMELDPVYCDVIIKRWEELTGQKAELIS